MSFNQSHHNSQLEQKEISKGANENSKLRQGNCLKRGKRDGGQVATASGFDSDWLTKSCKLSDQSESEIRQNLINSGLLSTLN